jgi:hypothetical protein
MRKSAYLAFACAALLPIQAQAAVHIVNFQANGPWTVQGEPFGLSATDNLQGSLQIDDTIGAVFIGGNTLVGRSAFSNLSYITGTRSWQTSDLGTIGVDAVFSNGSLLQFSFGLINTGAGVNDGGFVSSNNTILVSDGFSNYKFCNGCVTFTSRVAQVPEPSSWAMLIIGFGLAGSAMRRRTLTRLPA